MDKYEIAILADDYQTKREHRDMLAMRNVSTLTADERRQAQIDFHVADAECVQAYLRLETAKAKVP